MLESMARLPGERLDLVSYREDFSPRFWSVRNTVIWKVERQQEFRQPESPSWVAFDEDRWEDSQRIMESNRQALEHQFTRIANAGSVVRRVRVVEEPFTPYLYWELHSLHLRAQCGEEIRVIGPERIAALEAAGPVPEIVTLGESVAYRILYDEQGILEGAVRYTDPEINAGCRADIAELYRGGEDLLSYFPREVASRDVSCVR